MKIPSVANVSKICSYGKWVIIATLLFLAHEGIKYQQYITFPNQLSPLLQQRTTLLVSTAHQSPTTLHNKSPFKYFPKTPIRDKAVAVMVNTTMKKLSIMSDSKFTLSESFVRIIIITSWRSGSTFMGELLNSVPGSFYSYEPLTLFGINRIYNDSQLVPKAVNVIKNILKCNYSMVNYEYGRNKLQYSEVANGELITRNKFLKPFCENRNQRSLICSREDFMDNMCALSNYHVVKTVRLGLDVASKFLNDIEVKKGIKFIYIARDPRALVNSRMHRKWCLNNERCIGYSNICKDLERDYWSAKWLQTFDNNQDIIKIIRYEDFSLDIWNQSLELLKFTGRDMSSEVKSFIHHHTSTTKFEAHPQVWNTFRDPQEAPVHWKKELSWETIKAIQKKCKTAMKLWGYRIIKSKNDGITMIKKSL